MKQVIGTTVGFFLGGPAGALQGYAAGSAWDAGDQAKKQAKQQQASTARVELGQRRQMSDADADRKRLLQESARIGGGMRRRGPLTTYSGAS